MSSTSSARPSVSNMGNKSAFWWEVPVQQWGCWVCLLLRFRCWPCFCPCEAMDIKIKLVPPETKSNWPTTPRCHYSKHLRFRPDFGTYCLKTGGCCGSCSCRGSGNLDHGNYFDCCVRGGGDHRLVRLQKSRLSHHSAWKRTKNASHTSNGFLNKSLRGKCMRKQAPWQHDWLIFICPFYLKLGFGIVIFGGL